MRVATLAVLLSSSAGCHALLGIDDFSTVDAGGGGADASDGGPTADAQLCFGTLAPVCLTTPPTGTIILAGAFDTSTDPRCEVHAQATAPELCVIAGGTISVEHTIVSGTRALVLIGSGQIVVQDALDLSSKAGTQIGAASSAVACASGQGSDGGEAGGGAGGSFGSVGGTGGSGGVGGGGGAGGTASSAITPLQIRGGCAGGAGGRGAGQSSGVPGVAGGAVALYSGSTISITSTGAIYASGAGGGAGTVQGSKGAGGGGGSGGLIVLDAPSIQLVGTLAANGGGGGGGGDSSPGNPGADGTTTQYNVAALGGSGQGLGKGGPGGSGAAATFAGQPGASPTQAGGGGGGGGGAGIVWVKGTLTGTRSSPAPSLH